MLETIADNKVLQNYVSPRLCKDLAIAGFKCPHKFFWKVYDMDIILDTYIFDIDEYYKDGNEVIDKIAPLKERLPAFTIKDIEQHLPDYCICKLNNKYEICIDGHYRVESAFADRLPDAFASIMLACLKKRVIDLKTIR